MRRSPAGLLLVGLVLVSLNLRPAIASVPPLLDTIERELRLSGAAAGLLTTLPVLCMGALAPLAGWLTRHLGRERAVLWALLTTGAGTAARLAAGSAPVLFASTAVAGAGIAVAGTLLPALVKADFPTRAGAVTGVYTMAMATGATVAAGATVPLAAALGGWPAALASWALLAVAAVLAWAPVARAAPGREPSPDTMHGLPWRSRTAWVISGYLGLQSLLFYALLTWLAPFYVSLGWSATDAGLLLGAFNLGQLPFTLALPALSDRTASRRRWVLGAVLASVVGVVAVVVAPLTAPWLWMAVLAVGMGGAFALGLTLLVDHAVDLVASTRLSTMAFLVSYLVAAVGPVLLGAVRDLTGGLRVALATLVAVALAQLPAGWLASAPSSRRPARRF